MKRWSLFLIALMVWIVMVGGVAAQSAPPQIQVAVDALSRAVGRTLSLVDLDTWSFTQAFMTDSALGCPLVANPVAIAVPISTYTVTLVLGGISYEFRVAEDGSIVIPCNQEILNLTGTPAPTSVGTPVAPVSNCPTGYPGYTFPRLVKGGQARLGEGGTPNRLRDLPNVNGTQIGTIEAGTTVDVLDGPICEDASKIIWWRVNNNGTIGWTAEGREGDYFLAPFGAIGLALPLERSLINGQTINLLAPLSILAFENPTSVAFSPATGGILAIGGTGGVNAYRLSDLSQIELNIVQPRNVTQVAISPDGQFLAYSVFSDPAFDLFVTNLNSGVTLQLASRPNAPINSLSFSVSNLLAVGIGTLVPPGTAAPNAISGWAMYDLPNQRQIANTPTPTWVREVAFSPDGTLFAWVDTNVHVIIVADGTEILSQPIASPAIRGLAWRPLQPAPVGELPANAIAYPDGSTVRLITFAVTTSAAQSYGTAPAFFPNTLGFSPAGDLIAAINPDLVSVVQPTVLSIYDIASGVILSGEGYEFIGDFAFSPDGSLIALTTPNGVVFLGISEGITTEPDAVG